MEMLSVQGIYRVNANALFGAINIGRRGKNVSPLTLNYVTDASPVRTRLRSHFAKTLRIRVLLGGLSKVVSTLYSGQSAITHHWDHAR